jgi:hypothetical protein
MLERPGRVRAEVVFERTNAVLHGIANKHLAPGTTLVTDEWGGYKGNDFRARDREPRGDAMCAARFTPTESGELLEPLEALAAWHLRFGGAITISISTSTSKRSGTTTARRRAILLTTATASRWP